MKVGDEVYLREDSEWNDGSENNPIGRKGRVIDFDGHENLPISVDWGFVINLYKSSDLILASEYGVPAGDEGKGHPNASILMEIAKEAAINPEYWKEFQFKKDGGWVYFTSVNSLHTCLIHVNDYQVRRKPRTIRIGNYDVKKPVHLIAHKGCVSVFVETEEDSKLMLKALQELLGAKQ